MLILIEITKKKIKFNKNLFLKKNLNIDKNEIILNKKIMKNY